MASRALLLTADDKLSGILSEAIAGEACQLDRCKDIFTAVEAITRDRFDLLVIDWQEALEADFLLKTARDLKSSKALFAVGLVTPAQGREALESGADAILVKPLTAAQAAEMLLPKLGIEARPVSRCSEAPVEMDKAPSEAARPAAPAPQPIPKLERRSPSQTPKLPPAPARNHSGLEPSPNIASKRSRMLSLTAVVWPLIIVAALLVFDQWPHLAQRAYPRLSGLFQVAHRRAAKLPQSWMQPSTSAASNDRLTPDGAAIPLTGDLLADYASPGGTAPTAPADQSWVSKKADDIDLASVEALPSSSRLIAPLITVEQSRPQHEIPASLRFPPPSENARAVTPTTGQLVAPGVSEAPIALPETVSRTLLEHQVAPQYPAQAMQMGVDGSVVLAASIGKDGAVRELKLVSGYLVLAHAAVDAVKQWRYKPYRRNGENVEIETLITVNFKRPPRG